MTFLNIKGNKVESPLNQRETFNIGISNTTQSILAMSIHCVVDMLVEIVSSHHVAAVIQPLFYCAKRVKKPPGLPKCDPSVKQKYFTAQTNSHLSTQN